MNPTASTNNEAAIIDEGWVEKVFIKTVESRGRGMSYTNGEVLKLWGGSFKIFDKEIPKCIKLKTNLLSYEFQIGVI